MTSTQWAIYAGIGGVSYLAYLLLRRKWGRKAYAKQIEAPLDAFSQRAVDVLDRQEALKKRHDMLTFNDVDYSQPMSGKTLSAYKATGAKIQGLRDRWLQMMEIQQEADSTFRTGTIGTAGVRKLQKCLARAIQPEEVDALVAECEAEIDQLVQAHEAVVPQLEKFKAQGELIDADFECLREKGIALPQLRRNWKAMTPEFEKTVSSVQADPLGATEILQTTHGPAFESLSENLKTLIQQSDRHVDYTAKLEETESLTLHMRSNGYLLSEEEGNPDVPTREAKHLLKSATFNLEKGNGEEATVLLDSTLTQLEEARDRMQRHEEAREILRTDLPKARHELKRLQQLVSRNVDSLARLERMHHPDAFQEVGRVFEDGKKSLIEIEASLAQSEACAEDSRQFYMQALDLLQFVETQQQQAEVFLTSPESTFDKLEELRVLCGSDCEKLVAARTDLEVFYDQNQPAVNSRHLISLQQIASRCDALETQVQRVGTNWAALHRELEELAGIQVDVYRDMQEDVSEHLNLLKSVESVQADSERVGAFLRNQTGDRQRSNQVYQRGRLALETLLRDLKKDNQDWRLAEHRLQQIRDEISSAETLAKQDVSLEQEAKHAMRQLERNLRQVAGTGRVSKLASYQKAHQEFTRGQASLSRQEFENCLVQVREAHASLAKAHEQARYEHRQQLEQNRHRQIQDAEVMRQAMEHAGDLLGEIMRQNMPSVFPRNFRRRRNTFRF